ncbi:SRPBCC family protein [Leifsonia shinshuensis]|uniref:SRPBCC domain-containing protein n=1 Tax=Leifsonia shinshuensis TaxID=150026 RepID=A0A7G6YB09_9MICO|nr:SRPBCC family protein [Leifsonia shinshuensis]QNE35674.1 SRPBCC domain-containing protein [Leifsonia shinshuensis]
MAGLTVERVVAAPPERVWRSFTDPVELSAWFWPPRLQPQARIDATPGGALRIRSDVADLGISGTVTAVEEGRLLATTWRWDGEDDETAVTIELAPGVEGTRVTVRHDGFVTEHAVEEHVTGWNDCLDRLVATA